MKTQFKLVTAAVAAAVSLGMSAPLWAAAHTGAAGTTTDFKAERKRCQEMPKGGERDGCMKTVRANEKSARRTPDMKGADRSPAKSGSEIAGSDKMQKSPTGTESEKSSLPQTPKSAPETAGTDKGDTAARRARSKGSDTGAGSAPTGAGSAPVTTPKSAPETAGKAAPK